MVDWGEERVASVAGLKQLQHCHAGSPRPCRPQAGGLALAFQAVATQKPGERVRGATHLDEGPSTSTGSAVVFFVFPLGFGLGLWVMLGWWGIGTCFLCFL